MAVTVLAAQQRTANLDANGVPSGAAYESAVFDVPRKGLTGQRTGVKITGTGFSPADLTDATLRCLIVFLAGADVASLVERSRQAWVGNWSVRGVFYPPELFVTATNDQIPAKVKVQWYQSKAGNFGLNGDIA